CKGVGPRPQARPVRKRRIRHHRIAQDGPAQRDAANDPMLKELLGALAQARGGAALHAQVDGALLLSREQTQVADSWKITGGTRHVRQIPEVRLEEQAFVDAL